MPDGWPRARGLFTDTVGIKIAECLVRSDVYIVCVYIYIYIYIYVYVYVTHLYLSEVVWRLWCICNWAYWHRYNLHYCLISIEFYLLYQTRAHIFAIFDIDSDIKQQFIRLLRDVCSTIVAKTPDDKELKTAQTELVCVILLSIILTFCTLHMYVQLTFCP